MTRRRPPPGIRERDGRYQARWYDPSGKRKSKTFDRLTDAKNHLNDLRTDKRRGDYIDPRLAETPFDEWTWEWHRGRERPHDVARRRDETLLRLHVVGRDRHPWGFGSMPIGRISPLDVRAWISNLREAGYSARTIHACFRLFGSAMRAAVAADMLRKAPVGRGIVELPEIKPKRERFLTPNELERLALGHPPFYRPLVFTFAYTGLRWQEATGLLRINLDLDRARLQVRTVTERGSSELKTLPKTDAGKRTVSLNTRLVEMLRFHLAGAPDSPLVFPSPGGRMLNESNFRRVWRTAVRRAGLEPLSVHDLRHTHTSWLIEAEWPEFKIVKRLGWRDSRMLYTTYGHLLPGHDAELVKGLDALGTGLDGDEMGTKQGRDGQGGIA
jgi:integrase